MRKEHGQLEHGHVSVSRGVSVPGPWAMGPGDITEERAEANRDALLNAAQSV